LDFCLVDEDFGIESFNHLNKKKDENALETILAIDRIARIWIEHFLQNAVLEASESKTKEFIEEASDIYKTKDLEVMGILMNGRIPDSGKEKAVEEFKINKIKNRINALKKFDSINKVLKESYKAELSKIK